MPRVFKNLSISEVKDRVTEVRKAAKRGDHEAAASIEDDLWKDVLDTISNPACRIRAIIAAEALKTRAIKFPRWHA